MFCNVQSRTQNLGNLQRKKVKLRKGKMESEQKKTDKIEKRRENQFKITKNLSVRKYFCSVLRSAFPSLF